MSMIRPRPASHPTHPRPRTTRFVSPLDLRQTTFPTAWKGYDQARVRAFLLAASESFDRCPKRERAPPPGNRRLDGMIRQYRELETTLNNTLIQAQKVSDDMRNHPQLEAERIVREANGRAELLIAAAQNRLDDAAAGNRRPEDESAARSRSASASRHRRS